MEIKAHEFVPSFFGVTVSAKSGPSELLHLMISLSLFSKAVGWEADNG